MTTPAMVTLLSPLKWALLLMLPVLAGIAGLVLFIVGLTRRKASLWGSGLAVAIVSGLVLVGGIVAVGVWGYRQTRTMQATLARKLAKQLSDEEMFRACTGLDLPDSTSVVASASGEYGPPDQRSFRYMKLEGSPAFEAFLQVHFASTTWDEARSALTGEEAVSAGLWTPDDVRGKAYYKRLHRVAGETPGAVTTFVAFDAKTSTACVAAVNQPDE